MPFRGIKKGKNKGKFISPSGKLYSKKQVKAYYATDGWSRKPRRKKR